MTETMPHEIETKLSTEQLDALRKIADCQLLGNDTTTRLFLKLYGGFRAKNDTYTVEEFVTDMSALAKEVATKFDAAGTIHRGMNLPDCCGMWLNGVPENRATLLADRARNTLTGYSTSQKWFRDKIGKMNADSIVSTLANMCN